jgi:hypothetical protein
MRAYRGEPRETVVPTIYRPIFERVGRDATLKESVLLHLGRRIGQQRRIGSIRVCRRGIDDGATRLHVRHGLAELGGIDILVNKAAHQASFKSIEPLRMHNRQPPCSGPLQGPRTGRIEQAYSSLIAASDCAHTPVISLNRHRPTAAAEPAVIGILVMASVMAFTVSGSADVNPNAVRTNVHTLSEGRCRSRGSHCANQSKRDQRGFNPHGQVLSVWAGPFCSVS